MNTLRNGRSSANVCEHVPKSLSLCRGVGEGFDLLLARTLLLTVVRWGFALRDRRSFLLSRRPRKGGGVSATSLFRGIVELDASAGDDGVAG